MKINKIVLILIGISILTLGYFAFILYRTIDNDIDLKTYLKSTTIPQFKKNLVSDEKLNEELVEKYNIKSLSINVQNFESLVRYRDSILTQKEQIGLRKHKKFKANFDLDGKQYNGKIRLKGDTHVNYNQDIHLASFKVYFNDREYYVMPAFQELGFYGIFYYWYMNDIGFISPKVEFVDLTINNQHVGCVLFIESFKDLNDRSMGSIHRFEDDCLELNYKLNASGFPRMEAQEDFQNNETLILKKINQLKNRDSLKHVLDFEKWALYVALGDLFMAHHTQECHNVKLFFNDSSLLFEPIAWDLGGNGKSMDNLSPRYFINSYNQPIYEILKEDPDFIYLYLDKLKKVINDNSFYKFTSKYSDHVNDLEGLLAGTGGFMYWANDAYINNVNKLNQELNVKHKLSCSQSSNNGIVLIENNISIPVTLTSINFGNDTIKTNRIIFQKDKLFFPEMTGKTITAFSYKVFQNDQLIHIDLK